MKKIKILYIYGYGDNPECQNIQILKDSLNKKKYEIISDYYAQYSPKEAKYDLENIIQNNNIDIIIGEELGGYLIGILENINIKSKIVIDPIINPILELQEYKTNTLDENGKEIEIPLVPDHIIKFYTENQYPINTNNILCIYTDKSRYKEYSEIYNNIKYFKDISDINEVIE